MKKNDVIQGLTWMGFGIAVMVGSYRLGLGTLSTPGPGFMPFLAGIAMSFASLPIVVRSFQTIREKTRIADEGVWSEVKFKNLIIVWASLVGYAVALERLGYCITAFLALVIFFKTVGCQRWSFALLTSFLFVFSSYILFGIILKINLPWGFLGI